MFYQAPLNNFPLSRFVRWSKPYHLALLLFSQLQSGKSIGIIFLKEVRGLFDAWHFSVTHFYLQDSNFSVRTAILNVSVQKLTVFSRSRGIPRSLLCAAAGCSCDTLVWTLGNLHQWCDPRNETQRDWTIPSHEMEVSFTEYSSSQWLCDLSVIVERQKVLRMLNNWATKQIL